MVSAEMIQSQPQYDSAHLWPTGNLNEGSIVFPNRLFVGGLAPSGGDKDTEKAITQTDIEEFFGQFGKVEGVKMINHHEDGSFKGYAFVEFTEQATVATILNSFQDINKKHLFAIKGLELKLGHAVRKANGSPQGPVLSPVRAAAGNLGGYGQAALQTAAYQQLLQQVYLNQAVNQAAFANPYMYGGYAPLDQSALMAGGITAGLGGSAESPIQSLGKKSGSPPTSGQEATPPPYPPAPGTGSPMAFLRPQGLGGGQNAALLFQGGMFPGAAATQGLLNQQYLCYPTASPLQSGSTPPVFPTGLTSIHGTASLELDRPLNGSLGSSLASSATSTTPGSAASPGSIGKDFSPPASFGATNANTFHNLAGLSAYY